MLSQITELVQRQRFLELAPVNAPPGKIIAEALAFCFGFS
jgi:hypothetical protein